MTCLGHEKQGVFRLICWDIGRVMSYTKQNHANHNLFIMSYQMAYVHDGLTFNLNPEEFMNSDVECWLLRCIKE
jgi:hypothetical protein